MSKRILFQGDSITDCGRPKDNFYGLGNGYANLVKRLWAKRVYLWFSLKICLKRHIIIF